MVDRVLASDHSNRLTPVEQRHPDSDAVVEAEHREKRPISLQVLLLASTSWLVIMCVAWFFEASFGASFSTQIVTLSVQNLVAGILLAFVAARPAPLSVALKELKLVPIFCIGFATVFGLTTLTWLPEELQVNPVIDRSFVVPAGFLALAGTTAMVAASLLTPRFIVRAVSWTDAALRGPAPHAPSALAAWSLWLIWAAITAYKILSGSYGYLSDASAQLGTDSSLEQGIAMLSTFGAMAVFLSGWRLGANRTFGAVTLVLFFVATNTVGGLIGGTKAGMLLPTLYAALGFMVFRRIRPTVFLAAGLAAVLVVFPLITQYRVLANAGGARLTTTQLLSSLNVAALLEESNIADRAGSFSDFALRTSHVGELALVMQKTPDQIPYSPATDIAYSPLLGLIPRSLWNEKPVNAVGREMNIVYFERSESEYSSSAMTAFGDLWRHGGIGIVILGMAGLGLACRSIDRRSGTLASDPRLAFIPILLFVQIFFSESDFVWMAASFVGVFVTAAVAARLVTILSGGSRGPDTDTHD